MPLNDKQPPTLVGTPFSTNAPWLLRRIARPTPWKDALASGDTAPVKNYLQDSEGKVSLWRIENDLDLRRVAIAINESRDSFREKLEFLPILPAELTRLGVPFQNTPGETACPTAARLHYDADIDEDRGSKLIGHLLQSGRELLRCSRGQMNVALSEAENDGCFAVSETSKSCKCGENM
jgi:hypothetical protein